MSRMPALPRWPAEWPQAWIAPVLAAMAWSLVLASSGDLATQRSLVFIGGPLVLLAGLHARLGEYLHARARQRLAVLPIAPVRHFTAARAAHRRGFALAVSSGLLGVVIGGGAGGDVGRGLLLAGDFLWLVVIAGLIEPAIAAASAFAGRRFPEEHAIRRAQAQLGGGWTAPEAAVHLYAPALGLGLAVLLAMPGQLGLAAAQAQGLRAAHVGLLGVPLVIAAAVRWAAPRIYSVGFFAAVAWLAEAMRSLAGPPEPPPRPEWVGRLASPTMRLWTTQWLRLTPGPLLRLGLLVGWGCWLLLRAEAPGVPAVAIGLGLAALWLLPLQTLARQRRRNAALLASLPLPARARAGHAGGLVAAMVAVPGVLALALLLRWVARG